MSTNAVVIPEGHVAFCVLIHHDKVDEARAALAGIPVAAEMECEADVVFWVDYDNENPFDLPLRSELPPAPPVPQWDPDDIAGFAEAADAFLDWAAEAEGEDRQAAAMAFYRELRKAKSVVFARPDDRRTMHRLARRLVTLMGLPAGDAHG